MERALKNQPIWMWRYLQNERNYPGLNITAKEEACEVLRELSERLVGAGGGSRLIGLASLDPRDEARVSGGQLFMSFKRLRLTVSPPSADLKCMSARYEGALVTLEFTIEFVPRFLEGILDIADGRGDWSIGPPTGRRQRGVLLGPRDRDSLDLTFWPCFGHLSPVP